MPIVDITTGNDADFKRAFVWQMSGGSAIDLSGSTLLFQARRKAADSQVLIEASTANGLIVVTNAIGGAFTLRLPYANLPFTGGLRDLPEGVYWQALVRKVTATDFRDEVWSGKLIQQPKAVRDNS